MTKEKKEVTLNVDMSEVKNIMDMYRCGAKDESFIKMFELLKKYIYQQGRHYSGFFTGDDMEAAIYGYVIPEIINGMNTYDEEKGAPTTFFRPRIVSGFNEYISKEKKGISAYYSSMSKQIMDYKNSMEQKGIVCTPLMIHEKLGIPLKTIEKTLSQLTISQGLTNHENEETIVEKADATCLSPEDIFFEKHQTEQLDKIKECLTPLELRVINLKFTEQLNDNKISKLLIKESKLNNEKDFTETNRILTPEMVRRVTARALNKLKTQCNMYNLFPEWASRSATERYKECMKEISIFDITGIEEIMDDLTDIEFVDETEVLNDALLPDL